MPFLWYPGGCPPELRRAIEDAGSVAREWDPPGVYLGSRISRREKAALTMIQLARLCEENTKIVGMLESARLYILGYKSGYLVWSWVIACYTGWWYTYPSEKYESQWEGWHPIYEMENKKCLKPPTSIVSPTDTLYIQIYTWKWCEENQKRRIFCWFVASISHDIPIKIIEHPKKIL
jgi:hypothetical protein